MKQFIAISLLFILAGCSQQSNDSKKLQEQVDSLRIKLDNAYKPGFGEFMSSIQQHHAKLWFAGINNNWKLAEFEIKEIQEVLEDLEKFNTDRPETKAIGMIDSSIDSVSNAIKQQNPSLFRTSYTLLTNTCNKCHQSTEHEFNIITIPSTPPFSNQSFKLK